MTKTAVSPQVSLVQFINWVVLLACFLLRPTAFGQQFFGAEAATLGNGARLADCNTCFGGKQAKNLGGDQNGTATFEHVLVPHEGLYPMDVDFAGDGRSLVITVNNNARREVVFQPTAGQTSPSSQTVLVPLQAGENTIAFNNPHEFGPALNSIVISNAPVGSFAISGEIKDADNHPLPTVAVTLTGEYEMHAWTDANGDYEFRNLPAGIYYVTPESAGEMFSPVENYCVVTDTNASEANFSARALPARLEKPAIMELGKWRIEYDLISGLADFYFTGRLVIARAFALGRLPETVTSADYRTRKVSRAPVRDGFGHGVAFTIESGNGDDKLVQTFWLYTNADFFLTDMAIVRPPKVRSNYLSPLTSYSPVNFLPAGDDRALWVPFDNDKWTRYCASPFGGSTTSHEVSAFYDNTSRMGMVIGSVEHNVWKTGVSSTTASNTITSLQVFAGLADVQTRDALPHGKVAGEMIKSPKMFVGVFADWRDGLEAFARANATVTPARVWTNGVPFGWNSWGKLQHRISFNKAIQVSDFIARELQPNSFENHGVVYVGLDSGWTRFSDGQLKSFVDHCHANGQEAGIYFTPFAVWRQADDAVVDGSKYRYRDIYLYANGQKEVLDGGVALDPTHPGTRDRIKWLVAKFKMAGFKYVKADFLTHGALEADRHFDPQMTTGIQAYNQGMEFVAQTLGDSIYLNEAISPLFPGQYAHSRRIACDAFGDIGKTEYTLNALTYGWWLARVYDYNDPDHVVLDGYREGENRARVTSAVISGLFLSGDDFSDAGSASGKKRGKSYLTNKEINELAMTGKPFRPVEGNTGSSAANLFMRPGDGGYYLAALNYSPIRTNMTVDLKRIGLLTGQSYQFKELWRGELANTSGTFSIILGPTDATVYRIIGDDPK